MTNSLTIANKYAKAAFNVAKEEKLVDKFLSDLKLFSDNFSGNFQKELSNPAICRADLVNIIAELAKKLSISKKVAGFLAIIADNRRINHIEQIYKSFLKLVKADKNILETKLFVASEIDGKQLKEVESLLKKKYPKSTIEIKQIIKEDILGGMMIKIGSIMIDSSLKSQLAEIASQCQQTINN